MKIALIQAALVWKDVGGNLEYFGKQIACCPECSLILLPEMFTSGFTMEGKERVASDYGRVKTAMQEWAKQSGAVVAGSTVYSSGGKYYNRLLAVYPDGRCLHYDKRHCFTMGGESRHFAAGNEQLVFECGGMKVAAFICYDLRFPVWSRNTCGYDLAVYVANWPASRREVWRTLLRARAIENQAYVAGVNCVGTDGNGVEYTGDSMVAGAKGELLGECQAGEAGILCVEVSLEELQEFRRKFPVLDDRDFFEIRK